MKRWIGAMILVGMCSAAMAQTSDQNPGSLWTGKIANPYVDRIARHVGDVLTVLLNETTTGQLNASTATTKTDSNTILKGLGPIVQSLISNWFTGANSSGGGTGQTIQSNRLSTRMTVFVREVMPNGNLVVEGERGINVNRETQTFKISGVVRPDDIAFDNTIQSYRVGLLNVQASGKGVVSDRQRKGILSALLDWLF